MKKVGVVGLGYVGLPLARKAANAGFNVFGVDTNEALLARIEDEEKFFSGVGNNFIAMSNMDIIIVCVPTPINEDKSPDLRYINGALASIGLHLKPGQLVSIESTVYPGYCDTTGRGILEETSGLNAGEDFYLAHCPERINPGDSHWWVGNIPRVLGAVNQDSLIRARKFYSRITSGGVHVTTNMTEAEAAKMVENAFRDINIAFVNEIAKSFDGIDVSMIEIINAAATKPFGYMAFYPGLGVGGHCIPVDPEYLISSARVRGFDHELLTSARRINDGMVDYVVDKLDVLSTERDIAVLGLTYKPGVSDTRESQAIRLCDKLTEHGYRVVTYDPLVESDTSSISEAVANAKVVIVATAHRDFNGLESLINQHPNISLVYDTTSTIDKHLLSYAKYIGIGN